MDFYDLIFKILAILALGLSLYSFVTFLFLFPGFTIFLLCLIISFLLGSWTWVFLAFYPELRYTFFQYRSRRGAKKSKKKGLKEAFESEGGLIDAPPFDQSHDAVICVSDSKDWYPNLKKEHIKELLDYYKQSHKDFKLYFCYRANNFIELIKSRNVTGAHIFGHGRIDSLSFQEDEVVQYREFDGLLPLKEFIAQLHCNHGHGKPLGYYIAWEYFAPKGKRTTFHNKYYVERFIQNELEWTPNPRFRLSKTGLL